MSYRRKGNRLGGNSARYRARTKRCAEGCGFLERKKEREKEDSAVTSVPSRKGAMPSCPTWGEKGGGSACCRAEMGKKKKGRGLEIHRGIRSTERKSIPVRQGGKKRVTGPSDSGKEEKRKKGGGEGDRLPECPTCPWHRRGKARTWHAIRKREDARSCSLADGKKLRTARKRTSLPRKKNRTASAASRD